MFSKKVSVCLYLYCKVSQQTNPFFISLHNEKHKRKVFYTLIPVSTGEASAMRVRMKNEVIAPQIRVFQIQQTLDLLFRDS